jgi:hypothetical protein
MITQCLCNSFRAELFQGVHNFSAVGGDVFKIALYTDIAQIGATTTVYTVTGEVLATGYTTGGEILTGQSITVAQPETGPQTYITFNNAEWTGTDIAARGALIYNSSKSNKAVLVLNFGLDVSATNGVFTITMPVAAPNTALICFS